MDLYVKILIGGIILAAFWGILYLVSRFRDFDSVNLSVYPGVLTWRTEKGINILDRISNKGKRFWNFFGSFSAFAGSAFMLIIFVFFTYSVINYILMALGPAGAPSVPSEAATRIVPIPGVNIPLVYGGLALISVIIIHEGSHGIILKNLKIKIKSVGLALLVLIPGAFVEQDEEDFENASSSSRIKVASAGPIANVLLAFACFGLVLALISPNPGVPVKGVMENTPAERAGLEKNSRIISINGEEFFNHQEFLEFMNTTRPGDTISLKTEEKTLNVTLGEHPQENLNIGFIGIAVGYGPIEKTTLLRPQNVFLSIPYMTILGQAVISEAAYTSPIPWFLINLLIWMFSLNILVAIFNLLPLKPLDGGHLVEGLVEKVTSGVKKDIILKTFTAVTIFILATNFIAVFAGL